MLTQRCFQTLTAVMCKQNVLHLCRVSRDVILWRKPTHKEGVTHCSFALHASRTAQISIATAAVDGCDKTFMLVPHEASGEVQDALARFPHLRGCTAFKFKDSIGPDLIAELVQLQLCVSTADDGAISSVTGMQIAGLLDTEYAFHSRAVSTLPLITLCFP
jgi:Pullulanase N2 domain